MLPFPPSCSLLNEHQTKPGVLILWSIMSLFKKKKKEILENRDWEEKEEGTSEKATLLSEHFHCLKDQALALSKLGFTSFLRPSFLLGRALLQSSKGCYGAPSRGRCWGYWPGERPSSCGWTQGSLPLALQDSALLLQSWSSVHQRQHLPWPLVASCVGGSEGWHLFSNLSKGICIPRATVNLRAVSDFGCSQIHLLGEENLSPRKKSKMDRGRVWNSHTCEILLCASCFIQAIPARPPTIPCAWFYFFPLSVGKQQLKSSKGTDLARVSRLGSIRAEIQVAVHPGLRGPTHNSREAWEQNFLTQNPQTPSSPREGFGGIRMSWDPGTVPFEVTSRLLPRRRLSSSHSPNTNGSVKCRATHPCSYPTSSAVIFHGS